MTPLICEPIGFFHGNSSEKYMVPRQAELAIKNETDRIILNPGLNFEQALEDLEGFDHIWVLYWFHRNETWKPKVTTPREGPKRGVFATRSPHRPNPLGLSCVQLLSIKGREVYIGKNDFLEGTPILDIKPYLAYADSFPESKQGWINGEPKKVYSISWSPLAKSQTLFIELNQQIPFIQTIELRLQENPFPFKNHRIKEIDQNTYELSLKTWRIHYTITSDLVNISKITSGYDQETLEGKKISRWDDVPIHQKFLELFRDA